MNKTSPHDISEKDVVFVFREVVNADLVFGCFGFSKPKASAHLKAHCGYHLEIATRMMAKPELQDMFREIQGAIHKSRKEHDLVFVFWCRSGHHRSVAAAALAHAEANIVFLFFV